MSARGAAALLLAAVAAAACGEADRIADPVRPVLTYTIPADTPATRETYAGELRARVETDLGFRIGGKLAARLVDAGASVRHGQALARLDPADTRLAAAAARAQLASAEADHALAKAEFDRAADLLARRFISRSAYDARETALAAAAARVTQARAQADLSGNQQAYATLEADADGVVVSTSAEPGQVLAAGQPVLRLAHDGARDVVVDVPESRIGELRVGQPVAVVLWAEPGGRVPGRIREIAGGADAVTRTFRVRVAVAALPAGARLGMSATVGLRPGAGPAPVLVPLTALLRDGDAAAVWVVEDGGRRVRRRPVRVDRFREDGATIAAGLAPGEVVVAAGVHKLRDGQAVRPYAPDKPR